MESDRWIFWYAGRLVLYGQSPYDQAAFVVVAGMVLPWVAFLFTLLGPVLPCVSGAIAPLFGLLLLLTGRVA